MKFLRLALAPLVWVLLGGPAQAAQATAAVAASFAGTARTLAADFTRDTGHDLHIASGATGSLYTMIRQGAPYELFLAADRDRPARLAAAGYAAAPTCIYARGQLLLWSADAGRVGADPRAALIDPELRHLAIAEPTLAPYGAAALATLAHLGLAEALATRLVRGHNAGQAFHLVASGHAELGFVAASALATRPAPGRGSHFAVPADWHSPLLHAALLLPRGADNPAARAFLAYLGRPSARRRLTAAGYALPDTEACG